MTKKRTFFERLTGSVRLDEDDEFLMDEEERASAKKKGGFAELPITKSNAKAAPVRDSWMDEEPEEGQLTVDVYQTPTDIVIQTMVAGVRPEDLQINITRDLITIKGKREENKTISDENFFTRELYWGSFSRTISLPQEIEPEEAEAIEKHGLLIIRLPKINKDKQTNLRVKSL